MPDYVSSHGGDDINNAVDIVEETIPSTAHSGNKLTTVDQVHDLANEKIWGWVSFSNGTLVIRQAYDFNVNENDYLVIV